MLVQVNPQYDPKCLYGRYRIKAAKKYLYPENEGLIVNLYANDEVPSPFISIILIVALDLGETEVNELREEYSNAKKIEICPSVTPN